MNNKIQQIRVALDERSIDIAALGKSRELALALTTCQQGRMLLGVCLKLRGTATPYPHADDPKSPVISPRCDTAPADYHTGLTTDDVGATKEVRRRLGESIDALGELRRQIWARSYGHLDETVFDRAYCELVLAKNWLGMRLAEIAKAPTKAKKSSQAAA